MPFLGSVPFAGSRVGALFPPCALGSPMSRGSNVPVLRLGVPMSRGSKVPSKGKLVVLLKVELPHNVKTAYHGAQIPQ